MHRRLLAICAGALLLVAACGDDEADDTASGTGSDGTAAAATGGDSPEATVMIEGAWARTSPMMATAGAAYFTVTASVDDALVGVAVDPSVAATAELHETVMSGGMEARGDMTSTTMEGDGAMESEGDMTATTMEGEGGMGGEPTMMMQPIDRLELPAGEPVALEPGGYHIMMLELAEPLEIGDTVAVTLTFEQAGEVSIDVPVADAAP